MSISLNDHERRIKALEDVSRSSRLVIDTLYNREQFTSNDSYMPINLSKSISDYDFVLIEFYRYDRKDKWATMIIPSKLVKYTTDKKRDNLHEYSIYPSENEYCQFKFMNSQEMFVTYGENWTRIKAVYGIKIN